MEDVAIVSCAIDGFYDEIDSRGTEWTFKTSRKALDQAAISRDRLDSVMGSDMDAYNGLTVSFGLKVCAAGGYRKKSTRIQNGGLYTIENARSKIASGKADYVLIFSEDNVNYDAAAVSNLAQDAVYTRDIGENYLQSLGLLCNYYLENSAATEETFAEVAAQNYKAGSENPNGHRTETYDTNDILESDPVCWPLRDLETAPVSKGCVAIVMASEEAARNHEDPVWIEGAGLGSSRYWIRDYDEQIERPELRHATEVAYREADIQDPVNDLDFAEIYNPVSPLELIGYEVLDFCEQGEAADFFNDGHTAMDGKLPVNPSGGALTTNPLNSNGLYRTAQAFKTLRGELSHQTFDDPPRAVITDSDIMLGSRGCSGGTLILGRSDG